MSNYLFLDDYVGVCHPVPVSQIWRESQEIGGVVVETVFVADEGDAPRAAFAYVRDETGLGGLTLLRVSLGNVEDAPEGPAQGVELSELLSLPIRRWESAARMFLHRDLFPPAATESDQRRVFLAGIAEEYQRAMASGVKQPSAELARKHGVKEATVRTWISHARLAGLLPATKPRGRQRRSSGDPESSTRRDER